MCKLQQPLRSRCISRKLGEVQRFYAEKKKVKSLTGLFAYIHCFLGLHFDYDSHDKQTQIR